MSELSIIMIHYFCAQALCAISNVHEVSQRCWAQSMQKPQYYRALSQFSPRGMTLSQQSNFSVLYQNSIRIVMLFVPADAKACQHMRTCIINKFYPDFCTMFGSTRAMPSSIDIVIIRAGGLLIPCTELPSIGSVIIRCPLHANEHGSKGSKEGSTQVLIMLNLSTLFGAYTPSFCVAARFL